jgi:hypothetical protein
VVVVLQMFCPSQRKQPPSGGTVCYPLFVIVTGQGAPWFYLLTSIIERNKGNIVMFLWPFCDFLYVTPT